MGTEIIDADEGTFTFENDNYIVKVSYTKEAKIPHGTELTVEEIAPETDEARFLELWNRTLEELNKGVSEDNKKGLTEAVFLDITLMYENKEIEPEVPLDVSVQFKRPGLALEDGEEAGVIHFGKEGTEKIKDVQIGNDEGSVTSFQHEQGSFSEDVFYTTGDSGDSQNDAGYFKAGGTRAATSLAPPTVDKTVVPNGDGTSTLSLSVTGSTATDTHTESSGANVIVVVDCSNSMSNHSSSKAGGWGYTSWSDSGNTRFYPLAVRVNNQYINLSTMTEEEIEAAGYGSTYTGQLYYSTNNGYSWNSYPSNRSRFTATTRMADTKTEVKALATELNSKDAGVKMALIKFNSSASTQFALTELNDTTTANFNSAVDNMTQGSGTNWTQGLSAAYTMAAGVADEKVPTFVVFLTDGEPQQGDGENIGTSIENLANTQLFCIFAFGDSGAATLENKAKQWGATFYNASNLDDLKAAFANITSIITNNLSYGRVKVNDSVTTDVTSTSVDLISGSAGNFSYIVTDKNGTVVAGWKDDAATPVYKKDADGHDTTEVIAYKGGSSQYPSIVKYLDGTFGILTNDGQSVTYSVVTETNGVKTYSDPITSTMPTPDPVHVQSTKLDLEKKWDDPTDAKQRPDSLKLDLYMGENVYLSQIELSNSNNWTITDAVTISPGVMVSSGKPAYSTRYPQVTLSGTTYAILEGGHEYHFEENPMDYHFELTAYTYHPMLIDGVLYNVTFGTDGSIISATEMTNISATNKLKGRLLVTKEVSIPEGAIGYNLDTISFPITITLKDRDGNPIEGEGTSSDNNTNGVMYRIRYGAHNPDKGDWNEECQNYGQSEQTTFTNGTVSVNIYAGDTIYVGNLPTGATYEVSEGTLSGGWKLDTITYEDTNKTIAGNDEDQVTVTNTLPSFGVAVLKTDQGTAPLANAEFSLYDNTYETSGADATPLKTGLKSGSDGKFDLGLLGGGTYYLVETKAPAGYNLLASPVKVKVDGNSTKTKDGNPLYVTYEQDGNSQSTSDAGVTVEENDGNYTYTIQVTNSAGVELPNTGGAGTLPYTLGGNALIMASALMYGFRMRRR